MRQFILCLFACTFLFACQQKDTSNSKKSSNTPVYGGHLKLSLSDYPISLYPPEILDVNSADIASQIYEGLVKFSAKDLSIQPNLAKSWQIDSSKTRYTFQLKEQVKFHNRATSFDADDVEFTFKNLCRFQTKNYTYATYLKDFLKGADTFFENSKTSENPYEFELSGLKKISSTEIEITLLKPNPDFLSILATINFSILPKEFNIEKIEGTGPFKLAENDFRASNTILIKHLKYHRKDSLERQLPFLDSLSFQILKRKSSQLTEYKKQKTDLLWGLEEKYATNFFQENNKAFKNDSLHRLISQVELGTKYLSFNFNSKPFDNPKVRRAFNLALDKAKIIQLATGSNSILTADFGITPPSIQDYDVTKIKSNDFDLTEAKSLLAQAGYPNGEKFPEISLQFSNDGNYNISLAIEIQKALSRNLGIKKINIEALSVEQLIENQQKGIGQIFMNYWVADYPSAFNFLRLFYGKNSSKTAQRRYPNTSGFNNDMFNEKYDQAYQETDVDRRNDLLISTEQILVDQTVIIPLIYNENFILMRSNIQGFHPNPIRYLDFSNVYLSN